MTTEIIIRQPQTENSNGRKSNAGAKSKWSQALQDVICGHLSNGHYINTACALAGITTSTFYDWKNRIPGFSQATVAASAVAEDEALQVVIKAFTDAKYATWYLEHRYPDKWGKTQQPQININLTPAKPFAEMSDAELEEYKIKVSAAVTD